MLPMLPRDVRMLPKPAFQPPFTPPRHPPLVQIQPLNPTPGPAPAPRPVPTGPVDAVGPAAPGRLPTRQDVLNRLLTPQDHSQEFYVRWSTPIGGRLLAPPAVAADGRSASVNDQGLVVLGPEGEVRTRIPGAFRLFSPPVFTPDGGLLAASPQGLSCYDGAGSLRWSRDLGDMPTSPAVDAQGRVYAAAQGGVLHSFEADGTPRWSHDLTPQLREVYREDRQRWAETLRQDLQKPDLDPGFRQSLVKMLAEAEAQIAAPDAGYTGTPKIAGGPSLAPDGSVYVFTEVGPLFRFHPDGRLERQEDLPTWLQAQGVAFTPDGGVLGVAGNSTLLALTPDGSLDFEYGGFVEQRLDRLPPEKAAEARRSGNTGASTVPRLSPDGAAIYFGGMDGKLRAIDRAGNKLWTRELAGSADVAVAADGTVYGVSPKGLTALSPEGRVLWSYETQSKYCHVAVSGSDVLLTTYSGTVYALDADHYRRMAEASFHAPTPAEPTRIEVADGWVTIGGVRLPQR